MRKSIMASAMAGLIVANADQAYSVERTCLVTDDQEQATTCPNCIERALMITDESVVGTRSPAREEWSLEHLVEEISGSSDPGSTTAEAFVADWLRSFEHDQVVSPNLVVPARPRIRELVIEPWKEQALGRQGGSDEEWIRDTDFFATAPLRLVAIVNRIDLAKFTRAPDPNPADDVIEGDFVNVRNAGEGRFVFQFLGAAGTPLPFTAIFEYELPASSPEQLIRWGKDWRTLADMEFGDAYNQHLADLTTRFTDRDSAVQRPNSVLLNQIRTNEIALVLPPQDGDQGEEQQQVQEEEVPPQWELREFRLAADGALRNTTVALTPDLTFDLEADLRAMLTAFVSEAVEGIEGDMLLDDQISNGEQFEVPLNLGERNFRSGHAIVPGEWLNIANPDARRPERPEPQETWMLDGGTVASGVEAKDRMWLSFNTCNGCHSGDTGTIFTQIDLRGDDRRPGNAGPQVPAHDDSVLSDFLCEWDLPARRRGLVELLKSDDEPPSLLEMLNTVARGDPDIPACPPAPGAGPDTEEYNRAWMGCFMLERQTRIH